MKKMLWLVAGGITLSLTLPEPPATAEESLVERGRYLAEHVAMCVQCHSPRNDQGELIRQSYFEGAPIPVPSPFPNRIWAASAPRIAGLPGWDEEDFITLLVTGSRSTGKSPRPPMPPFRMSRDDAAAIAAYLKSLR